MIKNDNALCFFFSFLSYFKTPIFIGENRLNQLKKLQTIK